MKVYGALESAQLEQLSSDPANAPRGRIYWNTTDNCLKISNGTTFLTATTPTSPSAASGVIGSKGTPTNIVAGTGITATYFQETQFIQGSGGAVDVSANPQIAAGTTVGQTLKLIGCSNTNTVTLEDGNGLYMNGPWLGGLNSVIQFSWDGTTWIEDFRQ